MTVALTEIGGRYVHRADEVQEFLRLAHAG